MLRRGEKSCCEEFEEFEVDRDGGQEEKKSKLKLKLKSIYQLRFSTLVPNNSHQDSQEKEITYRIRCPDLTAYPSNQITDLSFQSTSYPQTIKIQ